MLWHCAGVATVTVLRDAAGASRAAQYLCWHPDQSRRLAVAHATMVLPATAHAGLAKIMCVTCEQDDLLDQLQLGAPPHDAWSVAAARAWDAANVAALKPELREALTAAKCRKWAEPAAFSY